MHQHASARGAQTPEQPSRGERLALASGIAFSLWQLGIMGFSVLFVPPVLGPLDLPAAERAAVYAQHGEVLRLGNFLMTLPVPFFLLFLGGLFGVLRRAEGGGALSMAATGSGFVMALLWLFGTVIANATIDIAEHGGDAATVAALGAAGAYTLALTTLPRLVLLAAASALLLRRSAAPRWLGWSGLTLGAFSVIGLEALLVADLFPLLALGTLLFNLWVMVLATVLLWRSQGLRRQAPQLATA